MKKLFILLAIFSLSFSSVWAQDESQTEEEVEVKDSSSIEIKTEKIIIQTEESEEKKEKLSSKESNEEKEPEFPEYNVPSYEVIEMDGNSSAGINTGMTMFLPSITPEMAADIWRDQIGEYKASRKLSKESKVHKFKDGEVRAIDMLIPSISSNLIDVYTTFEEKNNGTQISSFYDLGDGTYLTKGDSPTKYEIATGMFKTYGKDGTIAVINEEVKMEEKNLKSLEKEQKSLIKEKGSLERKIENNLKAIEKMKAEIEQAEKDIETNLVEQKRMIQEVDFQKKVVNYVKSKLTKVQ